MLRVLVVDSSSLFALERANLITFLGKIGYGIIIPMAVKNEIDKGKTKLTLKNIKVVELRGRTLKRSKTLESLKIGKGEAQCCALANNLKLGFIVCDDRKFIRQKFFSDDKKLRNIKVLGFSFFLHLFYKKKLIKGVWPFFDEIIKLNNWERSEVQIANHTFLKEMGY